MNTRKPKRTSRCIALALVCALLCLCVGCLPQYYTEEDEEKVRAQGEEAVKAWIAKNEPDAKLSGYVSVLLGASIIGHESYGLTDAINFYTTADDGATRSRKVYVMSTGRVYRDDLMDKVSEIIARKIADDLGYTDCGAKLTNQPDYLITLKEITDEKLNGKLTYTDAVGRDSVLPYEVTEDKLEEYVAEALANRQLVIDDVMPTIILPGEDLPAFEELPLEKIRGYEKVNTIWIDNASFTRSYMIWFTDRDDVAGRDGAFIEVDEYKKNDNPNNNEEWTRVWIRFYDKKTLEVSSESKGSSVTPADSE